jgi:hypothetical protein
MPLSERLRDRRIVVVPFISSAEAGVVVPIPILLELSAVITPLVLGGLPGGFANTRPRNSDEHKDAAMRNFFIVLIRTAPYGQKVAHILVGSGST